MRTLKHFRKGLAYDGSRKQNTPFFLISGLCIALILTYSAVAGIVVRFVQPTGPWGMSYGVFIGLLMVAGLAWLLLADTARRGVLLHERDRHIAELESELSEIRKK